MRTWITSPEQLSLIAKKHVGAYLTNNQYQEGSIAQTYTVKYAPLWLPSQAVTAFYIFFYINLPVLDFLLTVVTINFYFINSGRDGGKKIYRINYTSLSFAKLIYKQDMPLVTTCKLLILMFKSHRAHRKVNVLNSLVGNIPSKFLPCCVICTMVWEASERLLPRGAYNY